MAVEAGATCPTCGRVMPYDKRGRAQRGALERWRRVRVGRGEVSAGAEPAGRVEREDRGARGEEARAGARDRGGAEEDLERAVAALHDGPWFAGDTYTTPATWRALWEMFWFQVAEAVRCP